MTDVASPNDIKLEGELPELDRLLRDNVEEIGKLKEKLKDVLLPEHDDVWLLRYILSNKTAEESEEACRFTIKWRADHKEHLDAIHNGKEIPFQKIINQFQVVGEHKKTMTGEPVFFVRIGLCNVKGLMDAVAFDDVLNYMVMNRELTVKYCDELTKKERRLVKAYSCLDFQGASATRGQDSRFTRIIGDSSKLSEKMYPQLLGKSIFLNIPTAFRWVFNLIKPLMSKRAVEKMVFCPANSSGKPISDCPFVSKILSIENVPTFLGGKCNCPGGCIGGIPNSQTTPINAVDADGAASITISARTVQSIELPISKGFVIDYLFEVESRKIEISATVRPADEEGDSKNVDLMETRYVNGEDGPLKGSWASPMDGLLIVRFDNTHSMLRSKNVKYSLDIKEAAKSG